ncbi:hypothetical protein LJD42_28710, partial [Escherichia coli]|nr:hypothetical protein [Escherichia coli]
GFGLGGKARGNQRSKPQNSSAKKRSACHHDKVSLNRMTETYQSSRWEIRMSGRKSYKAT